MFIYNGRRRYWGVGGGRGGRGGRAPKQPAALGCPCLDGPPPNMAAASAAAVQATASAVAAALSFAGCVASLCCCSADSLRRASGARLHPVQPPTLCHLFAAARSRSAQGGGWSDGGRQAQVWWAGRQAGSPSRSVGEPAGAAGAPDASATRHNPQQQQQQQQQQQRCGPATRLCAPRRPAC